MFLMADKARGELQMGQTNALMLLMLTLALAWLDRRPTLAGLALGFAFNIKYLPIVFLPYLLVRRRWAAAGAFVGGIALFSFLPAVWVGWSRNLHYLRTAYSGVLNVFGINTGVAARNNVAAGFSQSITSAMARWLGPDNGGSTILALAAAAAVGCACVAIAAWMYRRNRIPILAWPSANEQTRQPYAATIVLEWSALIIAALVFSPQTNSRHMFLLLLVDIAAAALILLPRPIAPDGKPISRVPVIIGILVMLAGVTLPPGGIDSFIHLNDQWRNIGGPAWCMLVMGAALLWTGTQHARSLSKPFSAMEFRK